MDHLSNWIEIPAVDMKRAKRFYGELLEVPLNEMQMGANDYAVFEVKDRFNTGCLLKGNGYVPGQQGFAVYLNGGDDLSTVLVLGVISCWGSTGGSEYCEGREA